MGVFLYYLPGRRDISTDEVDTVGLGRIFEGIDPVRGVVEQDGPDGGAGLLLAAAGTIQQTVQYKPAEQEWVQPEGCAYWVGIDRRFPPSPKHLIRPTAVGASLWELGDGNEWLIPTARLFPDGTPLPRDFRFGVDGKIVREVLPEYATLYRHADQVWAMCEGSAVMEDDELLKVCTEALAVNYRVGMYEIILARLLSDVNVHLVLWTLVDRGTWDDVVEKKTAPAG